jgi:hypothetical protein
MDALNTVMNMLQSALILFMMIMGILVTRRVGRLEQKRQLQTYSSVFQPKPDPEPICGCGHHHCFHDETGCANLDRLWVSEQGIWTYAKSCGCKRYTGPEPLPTVTAG